MAVKIRLARRGRKKKAMYDVVIADARAPRDGRFIEKIGVYDPNTDPAFIKIDNDKAFDWLMKGALPTDTVKAMLSYRGLMYKKHLQIGVVKGAITQEEADKKLEAWLQEKNAKIEGKADQLAKAKADAKKQKLEAEAKVSAARAEALAAKKAEAEAAAAPAPEEAAVEEKAEEEATEPKAEEAPAKEAPVKEEEKDSAPEEAKAEEKKEEPKAEAPKTEEKKEEPKAEAPKTEEKKADEAEEEKKEEK